MSLYVGLKTRKTLTEKNLIEGLNTLHSEVIKIHGDDDFDKTTYLVIFASDPNLKEIVSFCLRNTSYLKYILISDIPRIEDLTYNRLESEAFKLLRSRKNLSTEVVPTLSEHDLDLFIKNIDVYLTFGELEGSGRFRRLQTNLLNKDIAIIRG